MSFPVGGSSCRHPRSFHGRLGAQAADRALPLKVAENGRFLVNQNGEPFLVVGDAGWDLIVQPTEDEVDRYLEDRQKKGFNSVLVELIEHRFCTVPPKTCAGLAPFDKPGDFSTRNDAYFDYAWRVVKKANDHGIVVWLMPAFVGNLFGEAMEEGWYREIVAGGEEKFRDYGKFVGKRFQDLPNIVWVVGGDFVPRPEDQWLVAALAEGIWETDFAHPITGHASSKFPSAVAAFGDHKWLTVDTVYTPTLPEAMLAVYNHQPTRPFVLIESTYEGERSEGVQHDATPEQIRRQAYWPLLCGAFGQFFGNNPLWHFDGPGLFPTKITWQQALDSTGSRDMARLRDVFAGLPWQQLVPEEDHAIVTKGYGEGIARVVTARTADKKLSVSYVPSTGTDAQELTFDLGQFAGPVTARWYNPTDGRWTTINDAPIANRGAHVFRTPGDNGTKTNDWLLILEAS